MFFVKEQNIWINLAFVSEIKQIECYGGKIAYFVIMNNNNEYNLTKEEATMLVNMMA